LHVLPHIWTLALGKMQQYCWTYVIH
jgi:hypothetical protein